MEMIKDLQNTKTLIDNVILSMNSLEEENKTLRVLVWRMIQKYGNQIDNVVIDDIDLELILSSYIILSNDYKIKFIHRND